MIWGSARLSKIAIAIPTSTPDADLIHYFSDLAQAWSPADAAAGKWVTKPAHGKSRCLSLSDTCQDRAPAASQSEAIWP